MSVYKNPFHTLKTISTNLRRGRTLNHGTYKGIMLYIYVNSIMFNRV